MKKSDLKQISNLIDERLDVKFDEKLNIFATKDDLKSFATKDDIMLFATRDDLEASIDRVISFVKEEFDKNTEEHNKIFARLDNIDNELLNKPSKNEIFDKWDNKISQMSCDVESLKYLHKDEWRNLPSRASIKNSI